MLEDVLHIFVITYNRCERFRNTLAQLLESPFAKCKITVLDNCSEDQTRAVAEEFSGRFHDLELITHRINIGGDRNFLRAIELSSKFYTWVLCDDDNYDFSDTQELISEIESRRYHLYYVASREKKYLDWASYGATTVQTLINGGARYHFSVTFLPSLIFRTGIYDCYCFFQSKHLFPSVPFVNKTIRYDLPIYISRSEVVVRSDLSMPEASPLYFFKEWIEALQTIEDRGLLEKVIQQMTHQGFLKSLFFWIALDRLSRREGYWKRIFDIFFYLTPALRLKYLLLFPVMLVPLPRRLLISARALYYKHFRGVDDTDALPPVDYSKRGV